MNRRRSNLKYLALGAVTMYLLSPREGASRRAAVMDGVREGVRQISGLVSPYLGRRPERPRRPKEMELVQRVHEAVARAVSRPQLIKVSDRSGVISLSGHILAEELEALVSAIEDIEGVLRIEDNLNVELGSLYRADI